MSWTDLTFAFGSLLTSTKMTQLDDNFEAFAAKVSGAPELAAGYVTQSILKTSTGEVSTTSGANLTLPGGEYGFYPQTKMSAGGGGSDAQIAIVNTSTSYITNIYMDPHGIGANTAYAQQRYITSSGEVHWVFILRDKETGKQIASYQAPDHPCFGNGGKPSVISHPFPDYDPAKHEIIVINPSNDQVEQIEIEAIEDDETKPDRSLLEVINNDYEINEYNEPWPDIPVTVGLPKHIEHKGKKILADYRFMPAGSIVKPVKKIIKKPDYILCKSIKKRS